MSNQRNYKIIFLGVIILVFIIFLIMVTILYASNWNLPPIKALEEFFVSLGAIGISLIEICLAFLLIVLILILFLYVFVEEGLIFLPFEVSEAAGKYNGKALSDLLNAELSRALYIHGLELDPIEPDIKIRSEFVTLPTISIQNENLAKLIAGLGVVGTGTISLPLGQILLIIKRICPWCNPGIFVSGSFQEFGSAFAITTRLEHKNIEINSWVAHHEMDDCSKISESCIPQMLRDLCYQMLFDTLTKNENHLESEAEAPKKIVAKSWRALMYYTDALEAYHEYSLSEDVNALYRAQISSFQAVGSDKSYDHPIELLINLGIGYINKSRYFEAEKLFRELVILKPENDQAYRGWGMSLRRMKQDNLAIDCYNRALVIKPKSSKALVMKAISLRRLERYEKALEFCNKSIDEDPLFGYAWGIKGQILEILSRLKRDDAKQKNDANELKEAADKYERQAISAYEKSIHLKPDFFQVKTSLSRIYNSKKIYKEIVENYSKQARLKVYELKEYDKACFYFVFGTPEEKNFAVELLEAALLNQVPIGYAKDDPDLDSFRNDKETKELYEKLVKKFSDKQSREDLNTQISLAATCRKLGDKDKFDELRENIIKLIQLETKYNQARFYAVCNDHEAACQLLKEALDEKEVRPEEARYDPDFELIMNDLRFKQILSDSQL
jgi:tetratricopeptide (TPR) repeat protein